MFWRLLAETDGVMSKAERFRPLPLDGYSTSWYGMSDNSFSACSITYLVRGIVTLILTWNNILGFRGLWCGARSKCVVAGGNNAVNENLDVIVKREGLRLPDFRLFVALQEE